MAVTATGVGDSWAAEGVNRNQRLPRKMWMMWMWTTRLMAMEMRLNTPEENFARIVMIMATVKGLGLRLDARVGLHWYWDCW